jgi:hypothetical protein
MFRINLKHSLAIAAVTVGVLAPAGAASATPVYNGHAGLGASVYQHNQTDTEHLAAVSDGTSNTIMFGARGASVIESIGTKYTKNEVTIETLRFVPDVDEDVL